MSLKTFTTAYIECALWSSNDESDESGGGPFDANYSSDDIANEAMARMERDCETFYAENGHLFTDDAHAGHDFWLTRNGHGSGFWDDYGAHYTEAEGEALTLACKAYRECDLILGNDNQIYCD